MSDNNNPTPHPIGRLYDALEGRYVPQDEWAITGEGKICIRQSETVMGVGSKLVWRCPPDFDRYILERCIGHRDSQGKWIFEGDVVDNRCIVQWNSFHGNWHLDEGPQETHIPCWYYLDITGTFHDKEV